METVEDLMIGKQTDVLTIVDKALMKRFIHRREGDLLFSHTVEDIAQTLLLLGTVGQDIQLITPVEIVAKRGDGRS